jgi:hypothetical protein
VWAIKLAATRASLSAIPNHTRSWLEFVWIRHINLTWQRRPSRSCLIQMASIHMTQLFFPWPCRNCLRAASKFGFTLRIRPSVWMNLSVCSITQV